MKKLSGKVINLILACIELSIGILLLINPAKFVYSIILGGGIILIGVALFCILKYFRLPAIEAAQGQLFLIGAIAAIGGTICIWKTELIFHKINWLVLLCGIGLLVLGIGKVQKTIDMLRLKMDRWLFQAISAGITLLFGLIIIINPFGTVKVFWNFVGIALIIAAAMDIVAFVAGLIKKKVVPDVIETTGEETDE